MLLRDRQDEAISVIRRLFAGERVTHKSDWFQLHEARLHLKSFTRPRPEIAVTSTITPNGAQLAGTHDLGMICVAASAPAAAGSAPVSRRRISRATRPCSPRRTKTPIRRR